MKAKILILLSMLLFVVSCGTHPAQKEFERQMKVIQSGNLSKFGKAKFKNDDVKFDVKFWKVTPKKQVKFDEKIKVFEAVFYRFDSFLFLWYCGIHS